MKFFNNNIRRRDFMKKMAIGGFSVLYGCKKDMRSYTLTDLEPEPVEPEKALIALHKTADRREGVTTVMDLLDVAPMEGKHVIVKPNFNTSDPAPGSTHNDTLSQIISEIKARSASRITLAERSYQNFGSVITEKQIDVMSQQMDFNVINLDIDQYTVFNRTGMHWQNGFRLPDTIGNAEYIVATGCLKTHHTGVITMSLKLGVGILPRLHMSELHGSPRINSMIAEINLAYRPNLIIMDGVQTFIEGGPSQGTERTGNMFIAGTDRIAIDAVGTAILKNLGSVRVSGKIFELEQIQRAMELKLGIEYANQIEFVTANEESKSYANELTSILAAG